MNKSILALSLLSLSGAAAHAEEAVNPLSFNVGAVSDYRYRGISQTRLQPAIQGGADYAFANGLYVGTWLSTISWIRDAGKAAGVDAGNSRLEVDLYAGYKGEIVKDTLSYDVGVLAYVYPANNYSRVPGGANADTTEIYGALTYGMFTAKYSHALTNAFGSANSKNSGYLDLSAAIDVGAGFSVVPHIGRQTIKNSAPSLAYSDYSLSVSKEVVPGLSLSAAAVGTNADKTLYLTPEGKFTGKTGLVIGAKYSF